MVGHVMRASIACSVIFVGCVKYQEQAFLVRTKAYFEVEETMPNVSAVKIRSQSELHDYIEKTPLKPVRDYLSGLTNLIFDSSFVYVTRDAELAEIRSLRGMNVRAAILKETTKAGIGIYIVDGDPSVPIKATSCE